MPSKSSSSKSKVKSSKKRSKKGKTKAEQSLTSTEATSKHSTRTTSTEGSGKGSTSGSSSSANSEKTKTADDEPTETVITVSQPYRRIMCMRYTRPNMPFDNACWGAISAPAYSPMRFPCGYYDPFYCRYPGEFPISNRAILIRPQQKNMETLLSNNEDLIINNLKTVDVYASLVKIHDSCNIRCGECPKMKVASISPYCTNFNLNVEKDKQKPRKKMEKSIKSSSKSKSKSSKDTPSKTVSSNPSNEETLKSTEKRASDQSAQKKKSLTQRTDEVST